uniref:Ig-like domain-containing protein n=1 Tax=Sparus aurata TaxID=8175 RepID=A0A671XFA5_SPAAU
MSSLMQIFGLLLICFYSHVSAVTFQEFPPQIVKESSEVQIQCSHDDSTKTQMLWFQQKKDSLVLTLIGFVYVQGSPTYEGEMEKQFKLTKEGTTKGTLIIRRAKLSDSAVYFCAAKNTVNQANPAYFGQGTKLTVLGKDDKITPPTVKVLEPSEKECRNKVEKEKRKKTLLCVISRFYPDHVNVTWKINNEEMSKGVATDNMPAQPNDGEFYKITSRLKVDANKWFDPENEFKCIASFFNGTGTTYHENGTRGIEAPKTGQNITTEAYLKRSQTAKLSYGVLIIKGCVYGAFVMFLVWKLPGSSGKRNN